MAKKEDNLKPFDSNQSREKAKINGRKGGIASGEARRKTKEMRVMLDYLLEKEITNSNGDKATCLEAMMSAMIKKAIKGDVRATEFVRDTLGQKPVEKTLDLTPQNTEETRQIINNIINKARNEDR